MKPLIVRGRLRFPIPAFIPTAAYATAEGADMKAKTYGKQMPKGQARPLGTKKPTRKLHAVEKKSTTSQKVVDNAEQVEVDLEQSEPQAIPQAVGSPSQEQHVMTLTLKSYSKNGQRAIYSGAAQSINLNVGLFPGKTAPQTIEVADGVFVAKAEKVAKVKLTKEERAALPRPTLAERIAKREAQLAKDKAKLAAGNDL